MARVSVILNSYNQASFLPAALESVRNQTYDDWELIGIDNGSSDNSKEVFGRYAADPRVILRMHSENASISRRFNEGIGLATGEFVCFLYSDDYYLPHKLATQVSAFCALDERFGVVYCPGSGLNELTTERWTRRCLSVTNPPLHSLLSLWHKGQIDMISPLIRRSCLELHPFYDDIFAEGEAVLLRIALTHWFYRLDDPLAVSRDTGRNAGKALARNYQITMATLERLERHPLFPDAERATLETYRRRLRRTYGWQAVRLGGDLRWGRERLFESGASRPFALAHPRVVGGLALSLLPPSVRRRVNVLGTRLRGSPENALLVDDFPGDVF